ncbi:MAG: hypothetical protein EOP83_11490 [Verrucomicrobiaceae bacterium]|nr:MAG: hypothetical protein EOP83_11490 [Verrucomicrobiaceae bacterium]
MLWYGLVSYDAFTDKFVSEVQLDDGALLDLMGACSMRDEDLSGMRIIPRHIAEDAVLRVGGGLPLHVEWFLEIQSR